MVGEQFHRFATDRNLGKLAKWLRLVGFDTQCEPAISANSKFWERVDLNRNLLVRSRQLVRELAPNKPVLIIANDPMVQFQQVIREFELKLSELRPFTRCIRCNQLLIVVIKESIQGRIPDYVRQSQHEFRRCPECERIYWPGSHRDRSIVRIKMLWSNLDSLKK